MSTILLVEANPITRKMLHLALEGEGYGVVEAADGRGALEAATASQPELLVLDYVLPDTDGLQLLEEIRRRADAPELPALVVTGMVSRLEEPSGRGGAFTHFLPKPVEPSRLLEVVRAHLAVPESEDRGLRLLVLDDEPLNLKLAELRLRQAGYQVETASGGAEGLEKARRHPPDAILADVLMPSMDGFAFCAEVRRDSRLAAIPIVLVSAYVEEADRELARCTGANALVTRTEDLRDAATAIEQTLRGSGPPPAPASASRVAALHRERVQVQPDATERQRGEEALRRSEARMKSILDAALDAVITMDAQGLVVSWNARAEQLFGWTRDEAIGRMLSELIIPLRQREAHRRGLKRFLATGEGTLIGRRIELSAVRRDGLEFPVELTVTAFKEGGAFLFNAFVADITERKRAEEELREAQHRLQHVVSSSPAVLYSLRPEVRVFVVDWIGDNVERLLGYTAEEALQPDWWPSHLHPEERERVFAELSAIFTKNYVAHEYRFRLKQGGYRWLRAELRLLRDADGNPVEAVGSWSDVSAQKEAELRLQESEEQYRLLFDSNPHPMWVFDEETLAFLAVNDAAVRHYGWSREQFLAMNAADLRPPDEVGGFREEYETRVAQQGASPYQSRHTWKHRKKDGSVVEVEIAANSIVFEGRESRLILATDVTEKLSLEAQLLQAQRMESVGRLAGGVAHDFNNILGVITGCGEILRKRLPEDPRLRKYIDDILNAAQRAAGLTRQLLAFSRRQVLQPRILDLNEVVREMEKMLRPVIGEDVQLVTVFDKDLPPVKADAGQLEQVLMNLAVNARDAMPQGGRLLVETGGVHFDAKYAGLHPAVRPGHYAMLAVSDTGQGMSSEVQAHLFEPFFTTKERGKGTGLGLATVHGIVQQSGGQIFVYSEVGRGSTFKVYLPTVEEAAPAEPPPVEDEDPRGTETVLVVEDESALREIVRECLESRGYTVLQARHGLAALELGDGYQGPIDLLLTDVVMPGLGGGELARRLTAQRPELKVLYMSGYTDDAVVLHGVLTADMPFLEKPFTGSGLARKVREVLDHP